MTTTQQDVALCEQAQAFLSRDVHDLFIDGQFVPAGSGQTLTTVNPSTGEVLARLAAGDQADVDRAVLAARRAFEGQWKTWTPYQRQALLMRIADVLDERFEELIQIEASDMGAPLSRLRSSRPAIARPGRRGRIGGPHAEGVDRDRVAPPPVLGRPDQLVLGVQRSLVVGRMAAAAGTGDRRQVQSCCASRDICVGKWLTLELSERSRSNLGRKL